MIRPTTPEDTAALLALTEGTGLFLPADVQALREVLDEYHQSGAAEGHQAITCEEGGEVVGFAYYAPAAMTDRTWYLWWIAVSKRVQAKGLGSRLLRHVEDDIRRRGRLLLLETSSLPSYELTRRFYSKHGYAVLATLTDYYADGHHMVIFGKRLAP